MKNYCTVNCTNSWEKTPFKQNFRSAVKTDDEGDVHRKTEWLQV